MTWVTIKFMRFIWGRIFKLYFSILYSFWVNVQSKNWVIKNNLNKFVETIMEDLLLTIIQEANSAKLTSLKDTTQVAYGKFSVHVCLAIVNPFMKPSYPFRDLKLAKTLSER